MNKIKFNRFHGGVSHCLTMSYDDGPKEDARLLDIFNTNGIKGTLPQFRQYFQPLSRG